jgi:hypothetical protein
VETLSLYEFIRKRIKRKQGKSKNTLDKNKKIIYNKNITVKKRF